MTDLKAKDHCGVLNKKTWKEEIEKNRKEKTAKNEKTFEDLD